MKITSAQMNARQKSDLLVCPVTSSTLKTLEKAKVGAAKEPGLVSYNQALNGRLTERIKHEEFKGSSKDVLLFDGSREIGASYLALVGFSSEAKGNFERVGQYRKLGASVAILAARARAKTVVLNAAELDLKNQANLRALVEGALLAEYKFEGYKSKKDKGFEGISELILASKKAADKKAIDEAVAFCEGTIIARDLVNLPPNNCKPVDIVKKAKEIAKNHKLQITVFEKRDLEKMGARSLLAVSYGSDEPPYLIRLVLKPKKKASKIVSLVGKGVTFDSGGLSIKPAGSMEDMKMDMGGAAAVLGAMHALAKTNPKVEVRAYVPTTENMINGRATRPGDVVTAMSGKSIEILNTDAEGRLILADALNLAEKDGSDIIVDLATLTGACMVALGNDYAGLFTDDDRLAANLNAASELAGERLWRMPLAPEYKRLIDSPIADIKNTGGRYGGAITAALFLQHFVTNPKTKWAHIDIAGPAYADGDAGHIKKGGVGFGVRTLANFVKAL